MATAMVTANSFKQPTQDAAHEKHRNKYRRERKRHRQNGEADLPSAFDRRLERCLALLHMANDIFENDDGVIDHKSHGQDERHEEKLLTLKPSRYITQNVPMIESGMAALGIRVARTLRRKMKMTKHDERDRQHQVNCTSCRDSRIEFERS